MAKQKGRYTRRGVCLASEAIQMVCRTSQTATRRSRSVFLRRHQGRRPRKNHWHPRLARVRIPKRTATPAPAAIIPVDPKMPPRPPSRLRKAPLIVIFLFLLLALAGIALNEPHRVLEQAWQVCLSCIGIG